MNGDLRPDEVWIDFMGLRITYTFVGYTIAASFFVFILYLVGAWLNLGTTTVGSIFAKQTYNAQYWVYLQPDTATTKNYRVRADIERYEGSYSLSRVYWDNGGTSDFEDCDLTDSVAKTSTDSCRPTGDEDTFYKIRIDEKVAGNE